MCMMISIKIIVFFWKLENSQLVITATPYIYKKLYNHFASKQNPISDFHSVPLCLYGITLDI